MKNILIHVTGSIACFKAGTLVSLMTKKGYQVQATASAGGLRFIQPALLEGLTGRPLLTDIFSGGEDVMHHISLSQNWADLIIAYPASANCICRLAAGLSDDLFGALCLANNYNKPLLLAPRHEHKHVQPSRSPGVPAQAGILGNPHPSHGRGASGLWCGGQGKAPLPGDCSGIHRKTD